jgi:hypothetical protein
MTLIAQEKLLEVVGGEGKVVNLHSQVKRQTKEKKQNK